jgi:hypothetical protein
MEEIWKTYYRRTKDLWVTQHCEVSLELNYIVYYLIYNVLFDLPSSQYDFSDIIFTEYRYPALIKILGKVVWYLESYCSVEESKADIIALQEVTPQFLDLLLKESWTQSYFFSDVVGTSVTPGMSRWYYVQTPEGNLLLSKIPFERIYLYQYNYSHKTILIAELMINQQRVCIGVVHLKAGNFKQFGKMYVYVIYISYRSFRRDSQITETFETLNNLVGEKTQVILLGGKYKLLNFWVTL